MAATGRAVNLQPAPPAGGSVGGRPVAVATAPTASRATAAPAAAGAAQAQSSPAATASTRCALPGNPTMRQFYTGREILLTGGTGFVGQALIHTVVTQLPEVARIYVLIRPQRLHSARERLEEMINSELFTGWGATQAGDYKVHLRRVLHAIEGDVTREGLGISPADMAVLRDRVSIMIHSAASIRFDDPLKEAITANVGGALNAFAVGQSLPKLVSYVHVSTSYVNSHLKAHSLVPEAPVRMEFDVEKVYAQYQNWTDDEAAHHALRIVGEYPNTYTVTKAMAEHMLATRRGKTPLVVVRPSIIASALARPYPGWVTSASPAASMSIGMGVGLLKVVSANFRNVADVVPVDFTINTLLVAAYHYAARDEMNFVHTGISSSPNAPRFRVFFQAICRWFARTPPKQRFGPAGVVGFSSPQMYRLAWFFQYSLPVSVATTVANAVGNPAQRKAAVTLKRLVWRARTVTELYDPFLSREWIFLSPSHIDLVASLSEEDARTFYFNAEVIEWEAYGELISYGMARFLMRDTDVEPIKEGFAQASTISLSTERLLDWDPDHHAISFPSLMTDLSWAYTSSRRPGYTRSGVLGRLMGLTGWHEGACHEAGYVPRPPIPALETLRRNVLEDPRVRAAIEQVAATSKKPQTAVAADAKALLIHIESHLSTDSQTPRVMAWAFRKFLRQVYETIRVNEVGVEKIRKIIAKAEVPVVLLPSHRSYMDFLLISYLFFAYNLPLPFIAAGEDFLGLAAVSNMLRQSGAFYIRRSFKDDPLYSAVLRVYMQQLLKHGQTVEFFLEGTRSRSGKMLPPKLGLLEFVVDAYQRKDIKDVYFVPVSLNFERALETVLYSNESLGLSKPKETLSNLAKVTGLLRSQFGTMSVRFADPILLSSMVGDANLADRGVRMNFCQRVANRVIDEIHKVAVVMPTDAVAAIMLWNRHGISLSDMVTTLSWLQTEIQSRGSGIEHLEGFRRTDAVKRALKLLPDLVRQRPGRDLYEVSVDSRDTYWKLLALGYYRNKLMHLFAVEGMWCAALHAVSGGSPVPVPKDALRRSAEFLGSLLDQEFVFGRELGSRVLLDAAWDQLIRQGTFTVDGDRVSVSTAGAARHSFMLSLIWPFVDSYWVAVRALEALLPDGTKVRPAESVASLQKRMQWVAETMYHDRLLSFYESCSLETMGHAIARLQDWNVIQHDTTPHTGGHRVVLCPAFATRAALTELATSIHRFRQVPANLAASTATATHIPAMSRL